MHKRCIIDPNSQKIKMEIISAKIFEEIDKFIKRDWQYLGMNKSEKKSMQNGLLDYVRTGNKNKYEQI